jgi:hypothetical protein
MIESKSKYYYTRLTKSEKNVYDSILSEWAARNRAPSFINNLLSGKIDIQKIVNFVSWDNPGLFYVDFSRFTYMTMALKVTIQSEFLYSDKQITEIENQLRQISTKISTRLSPRMDSYEKELLLHDYLALNTSYDSNGVNNTSCSVIGGLIMKRAVCEGYAKSFKMLCDQVGLSCIVVTGTAKPHDKPREELHAWNIVKINKECYHVDVTWDSTMRIGSERRYDYFNLPDADIAKNHVWDRTLLPPCTSVTNNWFVRSGNIVRDDNEFKNYITAQVKKGNKNFSVKLGRKYANQDEVMQVISHALQRTKMFGGYGISLGYNDEQNVATVTIS